MPGHGGSQLERRRLIKDHTPRPGMKKLDGQPAGDHGVEIVEGDALRKAAGPTEREIWDSGPHQHERERSELGMAATIGRPPGNPGREAMGIWERQDTHNPTWASAGA